MVASFLCSNGMIHRRKVILVSFKDSGLFIGSTANLKRAVMYAILWKLRAFGSSFWGILDF